jgi:hypothetical protein
MGEGHGLFDFYLSRHPVSDELHASLAKECAVLAEFVGQGGEHFLGVASGDRTLGDPKIEQGIVDGEAEISRLAAARFGG